MLDCDGCGACCLHIDAPPFRDADRLRVPRALLAEIDEFKARQDRHDTRAGPCLWFDPETRRCEHYEHRPAACRDFQVGEILCLMAREVAPEQGFSVPGCD